MRVSKKPEQRRAELIQAARELFDTQGFEKTRVSDIVARVGVAQGVFYYYFKSKDEMAEVVAEQIRQETEQAVQAVMEQPALPFCEKMARFIDLYILVVDQFLGDRETTIESLLADPQVNGLFLQQEKVLLESFYLPLVQLGIKSGEITARFPEQAALVVLYGLRAYSAQQLPSRRMIYSIMEQSMGIKQGAVLAYLPASGWSKKII